MKHVLVLGAGLVSRPLVEYLLNHNFQVTVASRTVSKAEALVAGHKNGRAEQLRIEEAEHLSGLVEGCDLAISLVPYTHHVTVANFCIQHKKPMVTTSYVSDKMHALDSQAREAGIIILNELGLDPGIDHMSAMRIIDGVKGRGGKIERFHSYCGGLPAPEANTNPWGYKFSWSPRGVVMAAKNPARYLKDSKVVEIESKNLFAHYWKLKVDKFEFEAYPNRDSMGYIELYGLEGIKTMYRGTLRNLGWCDTWKKLVDLNFLDDQKEFALAGKTYAEFMATLAGASGADVRKKVANYLKISADSTPIKWFEWLGLFSNEKIPLEKGSAMDLLVETLNSRLKYEASERDMIVLYHEFEASYPGKRGKITSTLIDYGIPNSDTSMSRTVGLPAAIGARLILEGKIKLKGVHIPVSPKIYEPVLAELEQQRIVCKEKEEGAVY